MKSQSNVRFSSSVLLIRHETSESDLEGLWYNEKELKRFKRAVRSQARYLLLEKHQHAEHRQDINVHGIEKIASLDRLKKRRITNRAILAAQAIIKKSNGIDLESQLAAISSELTRYAKRTAFKEANQEGLEVCDALEPHDFNQPEISDSNRFSRVSTMNSMSCKRSFQKVSQLNSGCHTAKKMHYA